MSPGWESLFEQEERNRFIIAVADKYRSVERSTTLLLLLGDQRCAMIKPTDALSADYHW